MTWCAYITTPSAHCQSHSESETFANFIVGSKNFRGGVWLFLPKDEMRKSLDRCPNPMDIKHVEMNRGETNAMQWVGTGEVGAKMSLHGNVDPEAEKYLR